MEEERVAPASESLVDWMVDNKLKTIGYTWLSGVGGSLVRTAVCVAELPVGFVWTCVESVLFVLGYRRINGPGLFLHH